MPEIEERHFLRNGLQNFDGRYIFKKNWLIGTPNNFLGAGDAYSGFN
jgi:hypothetical protein